MSVQVRWDWVLSGSCGAEQGAMYCYTHSSGGMWISWVLFLCAVRPSGSSTGVHTAVEEFIGG